MLCVCTGPPRHPSTIARNGTAYRRNPPRPRSRHFDWRRPLLQPDDDHQDYDILAGHPAGRAVSPGRAPSGLCSPSDRQQGVREAHDQQQRHTRPTKPPRQEWLPAVSASVPSAGGRMGAFVECHTDNTLQWRLGPDGLASLCNGCGQRRRRKLATSQSGSQQAIKRNRTTGEPALLPAVISPSTSAPQPSTTNHHEGIANRKPLASCPRLPHHLQPSEG